jgi:hypothetical protein
MTIPIYNSEIAPPAKRGMIAGLHAEFVGLGFAVANVSPFPFQTYTFLKLRRIISGSDLAALIPPPVSNGAFH